jgi:hypothetical protein
MSINLKGVADKVTHLLAGAAPVVGAVAAAAAGTPIGAIANIVLEIPAMIDLADEVLVDAAGPQKLAAVKAAVKAGLNELDPSLLGKFEDAWKVISPVISMIVTLKRFGIKF